MAQDKFDILYFKALKAAAKTTRRYDPSKGRETRVPQEIRPIIKQRATWQTTQRPKGKFAYVRYFNKKASIYEEKNDRIFQLTPADVRKWEKDRFDPSLLGKRIGKPVFEKYQGSWQHYPVDLYGRSPVKHGTAAGDIITYLSIEFDDYGPYGIKDALDKAFNPKKNDMRHFKAISKEAKRVGWPERFQADLTEHDKTSLTYRDSELPFLWALRDSGTHLVYPESKWDDKGPEAGVKSILNSFGKARFYAWDGTALREMNSERAADWIAEQHKRMTR